MAQVLGLELGDLGEFLAASKRRRVPVVLSQEEVQTVAGVVGGDVAVDGAVALWDGFAVDGVSAIASQ